MSSKVFGGSVEEYKAVFVGDATVGKTCLLVTYTQNQFPEEYVPTIIDAYTATMVIQRRNLQLTLWDTAGQEDFGMLRPLSYDDSDVFVICYCVTQRSSFESIKNMWIPELESWQPNVPFILVGTKVDLKDSLDTHDKSSFVSKAEAEQFAKDCGAYNVTECSALTMYNVKAVFESIAKCVFNQQGTLGKLGNYKEDGTLMTKKELKSVDV